jgi:spore germination protein YaaH
MRIILITYGLILLIISCNTAQRDDRKKVDTMEKGESGSKSSVVYQPAEAIWAYDYNQVSEEFELKQLRAVDKDTLTGETLEKIINKTWPKVQVKFIGISNDTAFISIPESEVLTQQMGSAGAEGFMISTTFSFTELKGINFVSFDFEEGDHGVPGVYTRTSWGENKNQ